ncbi:MAG: aminodeoxychorismate/anthranilate synthase component II [Coriobacteriales bacterium]|nr:aminodeoxychorismate/anthranilate synthase component II [Coriobacteriales bacterium]
MLVLIDNYDSFVYNLHAYFTELGAEVAVVRNDAVTLRTLSEMRGLEGIVISPGPKGPDDCGVCLESVRHFATRLPVLGVCLGHQVVGRVFGARVVHGARPMHGKVCEISHSRLGLFDGIPSPFKVTRYHSLAVSGEQLPPELQVDAWAPDGAVMAISHRRLPVYGVQFHPEAVLTEHGHLLLANYLALCTARAARALDAESRLTAGMSRGCYD